MPRPIDADAVYQEMVRTIVAMMRTKRWMRSDKDNEDEILLVIQNAPTLDYAPVRHGEWILTESPYAEYEEGVDGESHDRWTCSLCGGEAGFDCDPDGFASFQYKTPFCGYCGALMDRKEEV